VPSNVAERARHVRRLRQHLEVGLRVEQHPQTASHHVVVVRENQRDRALGLLQRHESIIRRANHAGWIPARGVAARRLAGSSISPQIAGNRR
jgi:hypothetical protein